LNFWWIHQNQAFDKIEMGYFKLS